MNIPIDIDCPGCNRSIKLNVNEMVPGKKINCGNCKAEIEFTGDDGRKVQRELDNLERALKKLGK
ncbi:hypothetical protein BCU84_19490 [Shewanella sp. 10N.286.51.B7]|uniref:hypothetical protein n=1 Tax=unclassified Shewanella TaxID=196818 RepID=UPI0006D68476|nr:MULTISPECIES: hypothetical protein [unclassified Shewanella]KPZ67245.1 hypothetical protein AN944_04154 [Shewanella sp. P1-14-1]PMG73003.1 hypothetical protein BCU84_19490 [Shewanella sp. 10N.286.51.B7]